MDFGEFIARSRPNPASFYHAVSGMTSVLGPVIRRNPYADVIAADLNRHLDTVKRWVEGDLDTTAMRSAMQFFARTFPGQYSPTAGRTVWRGQRRGVFDGAPRSYSYSKTQAQAFAKSQCGFFESECVVLLIERRVCFECADERAFFVALDLKKLMLEYSDHPYSGEQEVVLLNTKPQGLAKVWEIEP